MTASVTTHPRQAKPVKAVAVVVKYSPFLPDEPTFHIIHFLIPVPHSSAGAIGLLMSGVNSITGINSVRPRPVLNATAI